MEGKPCWKSWLEEMEGDVGRMVDSPLPRIADNVIRKADIGTGHRVLDLGAGMGLLTSRVARTVGPSGTGLRSTTIRVASITSPLTLGSTVKET